ncbi:hypothetical protein PsYK624_144090 [Phanerochaete sordida]|uniref:DH domain-containing protein n=1 Tax=Phanerochaete sordida TaxID=48140 RepID=A0A9P3LLD9_9APHY|nr:hypothetical protein PsYK624_144090 [Phanerochaete sordida]
MSIDTRSSVLSSSADSSFEYGSDSTSVTSLSHRRSFGSLSTLVGSPSLRPKTPEKPLPILPPSPVLEDLSFEHDGSASSSSRPSSMQLPAGASPPTSKRQHALLELLTSERSYAADLCLIRDIHMPLALGNSSALQAIPPSPPPSASSSRTHSTASDSSTGSLLDPPMTPEDVRIIFNNVAELATFSDEFTGKLEAALGSVLEGGYGEDHVGALFLETIPKLQPLYTTYITKHSSAIEHLNNLPQTPSLTQYLAHTSTLAQTLTHAWDLPSLLIKPVQRLLKYSLLLCAVIEETPESHPDKASLRKARAQMEEVAHGVNEGRRRREVVKEVLTGVPFIKSGEAKAKKKGLNMGVAASVNLGRIKSIRAAAFKVKEGAEANEEAASVARLGEELRRQDAFVRVFAKDALRWVRSMTAFFEALKAWAHAFGTTIGVDQEAKSEAFDAFVELIQYGLIRACKDAEEAIQQDMLVQLQRLRDSTNAPERLLEAMRTLEPLHYGLLNFNVSKSRPPPQLLEASKSYVALRGQLNAELPTYLDLLDKGIRVCLETFRRMQVELWARIKGQWAELWEALRMDEEERGSAEQTMVIWHQRYDEVSAQLEGLHITRNISRKPLRDKDKGPQRPTQRARGRSFTGSIETHSTTSTVVLGSIGILDPLHMYTPSTRSSQTFAASPSSLQTSFAEKKQSSESLHSKHSAKSGKSSRSQPKHFDESQSYTEFLQQCAERYAESDMPLPSPPPISLPMPLRKSSSQGRLLDSTGEAEAIASSSSYNLQWEAVEDGRGRSPRKPGFKRRLTDTLRTGNSSSSRHRRSPSLPPMGVLSMSPRPSPAQASFEFDPRDPALHRMPTLYECVVVFPLAPPYPVVYRGLPFFNLRANQVYAILAEEGHPSSFPDLPLKVDDGVDCLMMVRSDRGDIGWALASFLQPL